MKVTRHQLRRIIREAILREQVEDSITVNALFKWDDDLHYGGSDEARERVTISPEEFDEWGNDDWSGALMSWASENLDGGLEVSDIEVSPEDEARLTKWIGVQDAWTLDPAPPRPAGEPPRYPGSLLGAISSLFKKKPALGQASPGFPYGDPVEIAKELEGLGFAYIYGSRRLQGDELVDRVAELMK